MRHVKKIKNHSWYTHNF